MFHSTDHPDQPLLDATKPIACTIDAADIPRHVELIERIRINLGSIERTQRGVVVRLPATPDNAADLRQFAREEKRCCEFWGFEVDEHGGLALRWDGPPQTAAFMDQLVDYFEGRAPIGTLFATL
jgi:hypothetical protein